MTKFHIIETEVQKKLVLARIIEINCINLMLPNYFLRGIIIFEKFKKMRSIRFKNTYNLLKT